MFLDMYKAMMEDPSYAKEVEDYVNWIVQDTIIDLIHYVVPGWAVLMGLCMACAPS